MPVESLSCSTVSVVHRVFFYRKSNRLIWRSAIFSMKGIWKRLPLEYKSKWFVFTRYTQCWVCFDIWYEWVTLVDVLIERSSATFCLSMSKVRGTFKQVSKCFSMMHISHRIMHCYASVVCGFLDAFATHIQLCCFQLRLTVTKSGPHLVTISMKWVRLDSRTLDWSHIRAETSLPLDRNEWK